MKLVIPGATRVLRSDALVVNGQLQKAFDWPAKGGFHLPSARVGKNAQRIGCAVNTGTPVKAATDGLSHLRRLEWWLWHIGNY